MSHTIEIPLSKKKIIFGIIISLVFVVGALWIMFNTHLYQKFPLEFLRNPLVLRIVVSFCMLFFCVIGAYLIKKYFDKKPGLIINKNGIIDNSNAASIGLVKWKDITDIEIKHVASTKFILVNLNTPEIYISQANSKIKARLMKSNMRLCGTPITITSKSLNYNFNDLEQLLQTEFAKHKLSA
ncbi:STM3941 family protein [uncultured Olleya sp.]|uniref:STM3941 family protein n=1 Tax=uncultured Olleya sp. TaxID=757243 RepID=UPI0025958904|nr:STM3941 family protein [uncultured Olleya sp.]